MFTRMSSGKYYLNFLLGYYLVHLEEELHDAIAMTRKWSSCADNVRNELVQKIMGRTVIQIRISIYSNDL